MVLDWIAHVPPVLEFIVLFAAAFGALFSLNKWIVKPVRKYFAKVGSASDTLLGYDEIIDGPTGRVLQEATPPLANRVWNLEQAQVKTADALEKIAAAIERLGEMDKRILSLAERLESHERWSHEKWEAHEQFTNEWIQEHNTLHIMVDDKSIRPEQ